MSETKDLGCLAVKKYGKDFFGKLTPLLENINITDINFNGRDIWVVDVEKGSYLENTIEYSEDDVVELAYKINNTENVQFNVIHPILQADLEDLRFQFTHKSFSMSGTSVSIRKTPAILRISESNMKNNDVDYLSEPAKQLLKFLVSSRFNIVVCGLTGSGKTELSKFLISYIRENERIITIEDTSELHLPAIYPQKDIVELKVNEHVDYEEAIRCCMRMKPVWLLLSETRGKEVKELLKSVSTGAKIITSLHTDDAKMIPNRILNMFESNELDNTNILNMIYDFIDIGIHVKVESGEKLIRYVDQIVYYERDQQGNRITHTLYKVKKDVQGAYQYNYSKLPRYLRERLEEEGYVLNWGE